MTPTWTHAILYALSSLVGGFVGGWLIAYRVGRWRQGVDAQLASHQERLDSGKDRVRAVDVIESQVETVLNELRDMRKEMREDRSRFVTHEECERTHKDD